MIIFNKRFQINFDDESSIFGSLNDRSNQSNFAFTDREAFEEIFLNHNAGILILEGKLFGTTHYNKYYFSESHSCGPNGPKSKDKERACFIECDDLDEFARIHKRTTSNKNVQFTLDLIDVVFDIM